MAKTGKIVFPRRGDVYLVRFDPTLGAEIQKTRPALIIQNDISNRHSAITIVAAITSQDDDRLYPTEILISAGEGGLHADSVALLNQIRSIDKQRLVRRLGRVAPATLNAIDRAISISLGLTDI
jgi:mRNA interferase MazF